MFCAGTDWTVHLHALDSCSRILGRNGYEEARNRARADRLSAGAGAGRHGTGLPRAGPGLDRRHQPGGPARRDRRTHQRSHGHEGDEGHRRSGPVPVRLHRAGHVHGDGRTHRVQERRTQDHPRPAARRRHRQPDARDRRPGRDGHRGVRGHAGPAQQQQRPDDAGAPAHRPGAAQRPQPVQPGDARPDAEPGRGHHGQREPAVSPRVRERLRRGRRHAARQRRPARRRAAQRELQDGLHAVDGRGRGDHHLQGQRRRRERQQPGRHHQPQHEVGHEQPQGQRLLLHARSEHERHRRPDPGDHAHDRHVDPARGEAQDVRRHPRPADHQEQALQLHVLRAMGRQPAAHHRPHGADRARAGGGLQSVDAQRQGPRDLQPLHVRQGSRDGPRGAHALRRQRHPLVDARPGVPEDPAGDADAQSPGQYRQSSVRHLRKDRLLELLRARGLEHHGQLEDLRPLRSVQGEPVPAEPDRRLLLPALRQQPLRHEHGRRLGVGDVEQDHPQHPRQLLQHDRRVPTTRRSSSARKASRATGRTTRGTRRSTTAGTSIRRRST